VTDATDDPSVGSDERLYRRVSPDGANTVWDDNLGRWRPSSGALLIEGDGLSVFLASLVARLGFTVIDVADGHPGHHVVSFSVGDARAQRCGIVPDPLDPALHPCNPAHALVTATGSRTARRKASKALAELALFVVGPGVP